LLKQLINRVMSKNSSEEISADAAQYRVLFVCMGNICRSPTAEGVFRAYARTHAPQLSIFVDSAGTHAFHVGEPPDARARRAAERRGVDLSPLRARRVSDADFGTFDLILAMDRLNLETLRERCPPGQQDRLRLIMDFAAPSTVNEVPDPYYGGLNGFERVLDLIEAASAGLLAHLRSAREP
jgi:low molecular weight protein-tyrosine phosphatase